MPDLERTCGALGSALCSSVKPWVSRPKMKTTTTAMSATEPTSEYTALTPKFDKTIGISDGPATPEMRRPNPSVVATPHARISVG